MMATSSKVRIEVVPPDTFFETFRVVLVQPNGVDEEDDRVILAESKREWQALSKAETVLRRLADVADRRSYNASLK
jgi:hypothetical protein